MRVRHHSTEEFIVSILRSLWHHCVLLPSVLAARTCLCVLFVCGLCNCRITQKLRATFVKKLGGVGSWTSYNRLDFCFNLDPDMEFIFRHSPGSVTRPSWLENMYAVWLLSSLSYSYPPRITLLTTKVGRSLMLDQSESWKYIVYPVQPVPRLASRSSMVIPHWSTFPWMREAEARFSTD